MRRQGRTARPIPPTKAELADQDRRADAAEAVAQAMQLFSDNEFVDPDAALEYLDKGLALDPELANARYYRATILLGQGRTDRALADLDRVIQARPDHVRAHFARGTAYLALGNYKDAARDFTQVTEEDPTIAEAFLRRGLCYVNLNRSDEAVDDFTRALAINPANLEANYNRGMVHLARQEYEAALSDLTQAYILDSGNVRLLSARGQALLKLGRFDRAARDYRRATQLEPGRSTLYGLLAEALAGAGDMDGAIRAAEKALALALAQGDGFLSGQYAEQIRQYRGQGLSLTSFEGLEDHPASQGRHPRQSAPGQPLQEPQLLMMGSALPAVVDLPDGRLDGLDPLVDADQEVLQILPLHGRHLGPSQGVLQAAHRARQVIADFLDPQHGGHNPEGDLKEPVRQRLPGADDLSRPLRVHAGPDEEADPGEEKHVVLPARVLQLLHLPVVIELPVGPGQPHAVLQHRLAQPPACP